MHDAVLFSTACSVVMFTWVVHHFCYQANKSSTYIVTHEYVLYKLLFGMVSWTAWLQTGAPIHAVISELSFTMRLVTISNQLNVSGSRLLVDPGANWELIDETAEVLVIYMWLRESFIETGLEPNCNFGIRMGSWPAFLYKQLLSWARRKDG